MILRSLLASCACCCVLPAAALLTRPDRDDSEYLELASRYTSSVPLATHGEGVLIAPRWVLTAARVARSLQAGQRLRIGASDSEVQSIHLHPQWRADPSADIALVFLRAPVAGIEPTPLHRAGEENGQAVIIAGHGPAGRIGERATRPPDGRRRAAINTIDAVSANGFVLRIKAGDDASDLQGAAVASEAGRPAYLQTRAGLFVAGIGHALEDASRDGIAGNPGDREHYARVSAFAQWIDETMFRAAADEAAAATARKPRRR